MKLTNYIRDAYIDAVMADVPSIDHTEEIRKLVLADFVSRLPAAVVKVWKDNELRQWIKTDYGTWGGVSVTIPWPESIGWRQTPALSDATKKQVDALAAAAKADTDKRDSIRRKLRGAAYGCTTRKALAELLPEFASYLPHEEAPAGRSLPVVANLVTDFVKAGWPKNKKGAPK